MPVDDHQRLEWSAALRSNLEQITDLHGIVQDRIERHEAVERELSEALSLVERERDEDNDALGALAEASEDAVRRARLVGVKMEMAFLEGDVPEDVYRAALAAAYPAGSQSVGTTPAQRYEALKRIETALETHAGADADGALRTLAREGAATLEEANLAAKREQEETQQAGQRLSDARGAFDRAYQASKEIVGGLLRDAQRLAELHDVFPDM